MALVTINRNLISGPSLEWSLDQDQGYLYIRYFNQIAKPTMDGCAHHELPKSVLVVFQ